MNDVYDGSFYFKQSTNPLIIMGMHRSGTGLISDLLRNAGLHIGHDLRGGHSESAIFLELNKRILTLAHANWDLPQPVNWLLENERVTALLHEQLRSTLASEDMKDYWQSSESYDNVSHFGWGWKDPRNTFTLPLWLHIFPQAKVLNIVRNGIDVAQSLYVRENTRAENFKSIARSARCQNLKRCFMLWEEYVAHADLLRFKYSSTDFLTVYYEDFVDNPVLSLSNILNFIDAPVNTAELKAICQNVRPDSRYRFTSNPVLLKSYVDYKSHSLMIKHQYHKLDRVEYAS